MNSSKKRQVRFLSWGALIIVMLLAYPLFLVLAQRFYGGPHAVSAGASYGFRIGMSKQEVLDRYKALNETVNLRTIGTNGMGSSAVVLERLGLVLGPEFKSSDHWRAYRQRFPLDYQDFYFAADRLTQIVTSIRFYETP